MIFDAIRRGDAEQVRTLLATDPAAAALRTAEGASTVLWAVYARHPELAPLLLGSRPPDFFEACALGATARVGELLSADGQLVEQYSGDGFTGLGLASFFGHTEIARLLLASGAGANLPSRNALCVAPLHSSTAAGHLALVDLLLRHGADPNAVESNGMTPLHTAAGNGNREIIALLLNAGADRTRQSHDGRTPAGIARNFGHPEIAAELDA
jgi:ankyrin repeat protein